MHSRLVLSALIAASCILLACPPAISPDGATGDPNTPAVPDGGGGDGGGTGGGGSNGSPPYARPSGPIIGEYAGTLAGTETRSDGVQFESVLNFVVRFDYPAAPVRVTEIWESGETLRVAGIGVPIRREQVGIASLEIRQFTVLSCAEIPDGLELTLRYERFSTNVNLPALQSVGDATVRLIREEGGLRCELTRDWQFALSGVQSTWTASGRLQRNAEPPAAFALRGGYLLTITSPETVTDADGNVISQRDRLGTLRLRFDERGRFLQSQDPFDCGIGDPYPVDTERHVTRFNAQAGIPNEALTQVRDVRYFPDGAFIEFEIFTRYWGNGPVYYESHCIVAVELRTTTDGLRWQVTRWQSDKRLDWIGDPPPTLTSATDSIWTIQTTARTPISPDHISISGLASGEQIITQPDGSTTTSNVTRRLGVGMDQDGVFRGCSLEMTPMFDIPFCPGQVRTYPWDGPDSVWVTDVRYELDGLEFEARSEYEWDDPPGTRHHGEAYARVRVTYLPTTGRLARAQVELEKTWIEDGVSGVWNASGEFSGAK